MKMLLLLFLLLLISLLTVNINSKINININSIISVAATAATTATPNGAAAVVDDEKEDEKYNHNQQKQKQKQKQYIVEFYHEIDINRSSINLSDLVAIDLVRVVAVVVGKPPSPSPKSKSKSKSKSKTKASSSTTTTTTDVEEEVVVEEEEIVVVVQENMIPFQTYKVMTNGPGEIFRARAAIIINTKSNNITTSSSAGPKKEDEVLIYEYEYYVLSEIVIQENQYKYKLILQNTKTTNYLEPTVTIVTDLLPSDVCKTLIRIGEQQQGQDGFDSAANNGYESIDQDYPLEEQQPVSTIDVMNYDTIYVPQLYDIIKPYVPKIAQLVMEQKQQQQQQQQRTDDDDDDDDDDEKEKLPQLDWVFFRKYTPNSRYSLQPHCDTNTHSVTIALNDNNDYDGGGLFYIKPPIYLQKLYNDQPDKEGRPHILPNYKTYNFTNQIIIRRSSRIIDVEEKDDDDKDNDDDMKEERHAKTTTGNNSTTTITNKTIMSSQSSSSSSSSSSQLFPDIVFPKCNTGDALIYNYTVYHGISPILNGVRYALVLFFDMDNPAVQHELRNHDDSSSSDDDDDDSFVVTFRNMLKGVEIDLIWILDYDLYEYVVDDDEFDDDDDDDDAYEYNFGEELVISINGQQRNGRIAYRNLQHNEQVQYVAFVGDTIIAVQSNTTTADNNNNNNNNKNTIDDDDDDNNTTESWADINFLSEFVIEKEKNLYEIYNIDEDEDENEDEDINDGNGIEVKEAAQGAAEEEL